MALRKAWAVPPLFLVTVSTKGKEEPSPVPACAAVSEAMFPNRAQLSDHASVRKAGNEGGGALDTKSFHYFQCLIFYIDFKPDPVTASSPSQKPETCLASAFFSLPQDKGPWKI